MIKTWVSKRKSQGDWYVGWYENGRQKTKMFPTKKLAEHYSKIKYHQLNSDVFLSAIDLPFLELKKEFLRRFDVRGLADSTKQEAEFFLTRFESICQPRSSLSFSQALVDRFILKRQEPDDKGKKPSPATVNKDIERLNTFVAWMKDNSYHSGDIKAVKLKVPKKIVKALTANKIRWLLSRCPNLAWKVRILLSLVTGLRKQDIDGLLVEWIDLDRACIDSKSQKTGKATVDGPLPDALLPIVKEYIDSLPIDAIKLFDNKNARKVWEKIAGDSGITRQKFRQTAATLLQKVGSISSAANLLEHGSTRVTTEFYTDQELIMRWKVNQLPVTEWLKPWEDPKCHQQ